MNKVLEKLKEMEKVIEKMKPEELRELLSITKVEEDQTSYENYATLERYVTSGDEKISEKHTYIEKKNLRNCGYYKWNDFFGLWVTKANGFIIMTNGVSSFSSHPEDGGYFQPQKEIKKESNIPVSFRVMRKDICKYTHECPHSFFDEESLNHAEQEMIDLLEEEFPTEICGKNILVYEGWGLRDLLLQAMIMGAWLERNK